MVEPKEFLGRGWAFPVRVSGDTGRVVLHEYAEDVKEAIRILLSTSKGERVMRPEFGCGIHDLVFETLNAATIGLIQSEVKSALVRFEPRIELDAVEVEETDALRGRLSVDVQYRIRESNRRDNLVYAFYLRGRS